MKQAINNIKPQHFIYFLAGVGILFAAWNFTSQFNPFAALNFNNQPLFSFLDQFVLAGDKIELQDNIQISSGDLASNKNLLISEINIINGNLFSDAIRIEATSTINGNASFNNLQIEPTAQILGQTSIPISLPIIKLPTIPDFQPGNQDLTINQDQTINPGSFDEIQVQENISLALNPGAYNLNKLELRNNSKLLFSGKTIINIQKNLVIKEKVLIAQTTSIPSTDLQINVQEDKDIDIGAGSLLSFKLLAPNSQVDLGQRATFRGQILAEEIRVGEDAILSRQDFFSKESNPAKVAEDQGIKFIVNEILILFKDEATQVDAQRVADLVNGRITGFIPTPKIFKVEVLTQTLRELNNKFQIIKDSNNLLIISIARNFIGE